MILCFDTETTGKYNFKGKPQDLDQPRIVQLGAVLLSDNWVPRVHLNAIIRPSGFKVSNEVARIHGITHEIAEQNGLSCSVVWELFQEMALKADIVMGYNLQFDLSMISVECCRSRLNWTFKNQFERIDVMLLMKDVMQMPGNYGDWKFPKLTEAYEFLFGKPLKGAHGAMADALATIKIYRKYLECLPTEE